MILKIGTDCSGMEAPIEALKQLNKKFKHVFSSENNKYCIETIQANCDPNIIFTDITCRNIKDVPNIDIYICGFPCQPFSYAGKRMGVVDNRFDIFWSCYNVIKFKIPKVFILENVPGLLTQNNGVVFKMIIENLTYLNVYDVYYKILNTLDYGIPQHRKRLYIIGIRKDIKTKNFKFPAAIKAKKLINFVDQTDSCEVKECKSATELLTKIPENSLFIDFNFRRTNFPNSDKYSPCILATNQTWCVPKHRYANIKELLMLQGFSSNYKQVVSDFQFKKQIGNAMSVNVLKCLFLSIFKSAKL